MKKHKENKTIKLKRKNKEVIILNQQEIEYIVNKWYTNGMYPDILQDEDGRDLEEILDIQY